VICIQGKWTVEPDDTLPTSLADDVQEAVVRGAVHLHPVPLSGGRDLPHRRDRRRKQTVGGRQFGKVPARRYYHRL
jgi:hypothetical protein